MDDIKKIAVICGGSSPEREISLQSGSGVGNALIELGYQTSIIDFRDLNDLSILKNYDLVFIALHGSWNSSKKVGYKVIRVKFDKSGKPVKTNDFLIGFLNDSLIKPIDLKSCIDKDSNCTPIHALA